MLDCTKASQAPPRPGLAVHHNQPGAKPHPGSPQQNHHSSSTQTGRRKTDKRQTSGSSPAPPPPGPWSPCPTHRSLGRGSGGAPPHLQTLEEDSSPHGIRRGLQCPRTLHCSLCHPASVHQKQGGWMLSSVIFKVWLFSRGLHLWHWQGQDLQGDRLFPSSMRSESRGSPGLQSRPRSGDTQNYLRETQ